MLKQNKDYKVILCLTQKESEQLFVAIMFVVNLNNLILDNLKLGDLLKIEKNKENFYRLNNMNMILYDIASRIS